MLFAETELKPTDEFFSDLDKEKHCLTLWKNGENYLTQGEPCEQK
jgi:hypothetical protein